MAHVFVIPVEILALVEGKTDEVQNISKGSTKKVDIDLIGAFN